VTGSTSAGATATKGPAVAATTKLEIKFTYAAQSGGQVHDPYVAAWVEDSAGELVKILSIWYNQRESRYVNELQRFVSVYNAAAAKATVDVDSVSGATRVPGSYSLEWDAKDAAGALVAQGDYFVCVEAAREHGPYELLRGKIALGAAATSIQLTDNGELSGGSATVTV
jgi:hypothetical protein